MPKETILTDFIKQAIADVLNAHRAFPVGEVVAAPGPIAFCDDDLDLLSFYDIYVNAGEESFKRMYAVCPKCNRVYVTHWVSGVARLYRKADN
jgi:hypothetical protein